MENNIKLRAKELEREYLRSWRNKNREHVNAYHREWRRKNPDKIKANKERYWMKKAAMEVFS